MYSADFQKNYFELFGLPQRFDVPLKQLGARFRQLQQELHPDRFAAAPAHEQRMALQYSSLVNEAYTTLSKPLQRALYLLQLEGMSAEKVASEHIDGGFLIEQMELREKLESVASLVDPETVLDHVATEIAADIKNHQKEFATAYAAGQMSSAASACVKMQYLEKLLQETELIESELMDKL